MAYSFAVVEAALARLHQIDEQAMGAFRARVQNFQKMGVAIVRPGKGNRVLYNQDAILMWALCLELSELGIGPTAIKDFVLKHWANSAIRHAFVRIDLEKDQGDLFLLFNPNMLRQMSEEEEKNQIQFASSKDVAEKLSHFQFRAIVINISNVRDRLVQALADLHHQGDSQAARRAMA